MKSKIFSVAITFALFFSAKIALAETIVDLDIYVDTTWTKEMSPIVIKSNTRNDMIRRVINGATLTIESGVVVRFEKGMSLQIFSSCLRGYNSETCYRRVFDYDPSRVFDHDHGVSLSAIRILVRAL